MTTLTHRCLGTIDCGGCAWERIRGANEAWWQGRTRYGDPLPTVRRCRLPDCRGLAYSRRLCVAHYMRWYRTKDVRAATPIQRREPA